MMRQTEATTDSFESAFQVEPVMRIADRVSAQVRDYILKNDLAEGARLPSERRLAELVGSSRPTVSQALRSLAITGLIEIRPGAGAFVLRQPGAMVDSSLRLIMSMSPESLGEMMDLRRMLEESARRRIEMLPGLELSGIENALNRLDLPEVSASEWMAVDTVFHVEFAKLANNRYLTHIFASAHAAVVDMAYANWVTNNEVPAWLIGDRLRGQIALHRLIFTSLRDRKFDELDRALIEHQRLLQQHLAQLMPSRP